MDLLRRGTGEGADGGDLRSRLAGAWLWLLSDPGGRWLTIAILLLLSVAAPAVHFRVDAASPLRILLLGLPSLLTLLAFFVLAAMRLGWGRRTFLAGAGLYLAAGFLASLIPGSYLSNVWEGRPLGLLIWPTVTLVYVGPILGLWPDHAE